MKPQHLTHLRQWPYCTRALANLYLVPMCPTFQYVSMHYMKKHHHLSWVYRSQSPSHVEYSYAEYRKGQSIHKEQRTHISLLLGLQASFCIHSIRTSILPLKANGGSHIPEQYESRQKRL